MRTYLRSSSTLIKSVTSLLSKKIIFEMNLSDIFLLLSLVLFVQSIVLAPVDGGSKTVSTFVGDLVHDAVASEKSDFFDILLMRMKTNAENDLYGEIALKVSPVTVLTVDCSFSRETKILKRFSMIIVVTDDKNGVTK